MAGELAIINPKTIGTELEKFIPQMERALPRHMTADRMARIALTSLRVNPKLMNCTRDSFYGSLMAASQLGLEPGINGQCYLIPYKTTCTLVPGWRGYMDLLNRTERASAWTEAVYDGDEFDYSLGTNPQIHHKRGKWAGTEAALKYVYAVGRIKNSEYPVIDVWDIDKIWAHRDNNNKCFDKRDHYSFKHPEMYARKIPLLQVLKYLPSSIELSNASALDVTASEGRQNLTIDMALKGDLETGGESEVEVIAPDEEVDALFAKLGKNEAQRGILRKDKSRDELIALLKEQIGRTEVQTSSETQEKRGRGRPPKQTVEPVAAKEEDTTAQTTTGSTVGGTTVETKAEEKPAKAEEKLVEKQENAPEEGSFNF